mgnify:CR=1 FL=1
MRVLCLVSSLIVFPIASIPSFATEFSYPQYLNPVSTGENSSDSTLDLVASVNGTWIAIWITIEGNPAPHGRDKDLLYSRSIDNGVTWSTPQYLNSNPESDTHNDDLAQIATDGNGTWIAVWTTEEILEDNSNPPDDLVYAVSTDDGVTWSPQSLVYAAGSSDAIEDRDPTIDTDRAGRWIAVWSVHDENGLGEDDLVYARSDDGGSSWSTPATLNSYFASDTGGDSKPNLATDRAGNWVVVWHSGNSFGGSLGSGRDIVAARSTNHGI